MKEYICIVAHRQPAGPGFIERGPGDRVLFGYDPGPYWKEAEPPPDIAGYHPPIPPLARGNKGKEKTIKEGDDG